MTGSETALVFDIKRFAVHDGAGIRTTVFFKGCPLRCRWCQNPEGLEESQRPVFFQSRCIHCGSCLKVADPEQEKWENNGPVWNFKWRGDWNRAVHACPTGALAMDSRRYTVSELMEKIREDRVFFRENGGVTFSGGEPLLQNTFLTAVLKQCRKEGIHTAVETSLSVSSEAVRNTVPYLDQIFADFKLFDGDQHRKHTGMDNTQITENIRFLLESDHRDAVTVRTPLIPGITADYDNIQKIAHMISSLYPEVKYELLNYNTLAPAKYPMTGKTYPLMDTLARFSEKEMDRFYQAASDGGVRNTVREEKASV